MKRAMLIFLALSIICSFSHAQSFYGTSLVNSSDSVSAIIITGDFRTTENCVADGQGSFCTANYTSSGTLYIRTNATVENSSQILGSEWILLNISTRVAKDNDACEFNFQCSSKRCENGICVPEEKTPGIPFIFVPLTPSIMQRTYDYQSPIGITLTPVSDITNYVMISTTGFFETASQDPAGYMLIVSFFAVIIIYAIRNQKRIRKFFRKQKTGKEDAQENDNQKTFDSGASQNE